MQALRAIGADGGNWAARDCALEMGCCCTLSLDATALAKAESSLEVKEAEAAAVTVVVFIGGIRGEKLARAVG